MITHQVTAGEAIAAGQPVGLGSDGLLYGFPPGAVRAGKPHWKDHPDGTVTIVYPFTVEIPDPPADEPVTAGERS